MTDVVMPQLGETVTEGTITKWFKNVGDTIAVDEVLFEVSTDKVDSEVPSPVAGTITEFVVAEGDTVDVGTVLVRVDTGGEPAVQSAPAAASAPAAEPAPAPAARASAQTAPLPSPPIFGAPDEPGDGRLLSPVVRRLISDNGLVASEIVGTGMAGRITRADVELLIQAASDGSPSPASKAASASSLPPTEPQQVAAKPAPAAAVEPVGKRDEVIALSNIRKVTGTRMVETKQTSPHVLTAIEVDYENVERVRRAHKAQWKAEEGFSLTYLPFIARALADALEDFPQLNASITDTELTVHGDLHLAIAVDLDFAGLMAPVVRNVDTKRLRAISRDIVDLASRARQKKITASEISGGTFTITNAGQYGTLMQFPLINQPQVAILSTDGISRKPVVVTHTDGSEAIAVHSVGVLALAWDHRAFDGAYAAAFLDRMRTILETRDWEAEI